MPSAPVNVGNSSQSFQTTNNNVEVVAPTTSEVAEQPTVIITQNNDVAEPVATTTESSEPIVIESTTTTTDSIEPVVAISTNEVELIVEEPELVVEPKIYPYIVFHISDHFGGASVDIDENGDIISLTDYYPFGSIRVNENNTDFENSHKFTGHEYDDETDLTYMKARYYDGGMGRFISVDPVSVITNPKEFKAKTGMDYAKYLSDPQLLNTYSYVRNNPLTYTDPSGEFLDIAADIAFIAYDLCKVGQAIFTGDVAGEITSLGLDIAGAALPGVTGLGAVARTARMADKAVDARSIVNKLPDDALVCRGGTCNADRFINGS